MATENDNGGSQVIARAAAILRALEQQPQGLTLSALARATALPRTTVHRLVGSLEAQQLVINGDDGVRLGPALLRLAASAHTDMISLARGSIEKLGRKTRETVDLCVFRGTHSVSVDQYPSDQELRVVSAIGTAFPVHTTAHGKALLAALPTAQLEALPAPFERRTPHTLTSKEALLADLAAARERGYALDQQEHAPGVCGLGVWLDTGLAEHYAIALAVPALRFQETFPQLLSALMQCRAEIVSLIGGAAS
ncbi:IclR family transcriptional regulator [Pantoea sp.]|uniref:IclR family transcriptional regulator n=1 Tax=Pantoea sp. TaxID=69393 RepID=UPI00289F5F41|nr:IclR family transcriptional regulator [Pantoea sp.]